MRLESLRDLFVEELKGLYTAEKQLIRALPRMAKAAASDELRMAMQEHLEETEQQIDRLKTIFKELEASPRGNKGKSMKGLIDESMEAIDIEAEPCLKDAALIATAQRVEHHEMAGYGTVRKYAHLLGLDEAANLLQETLDEEAAADQRLGEIAQSINEAAHAQA
ncbi:MAG: ferritin-like domain-containing protein [Planctomycetes bacterium]|jgi:ferritin-like metal-binding protein YciE|nr:ferritin-like domain-containing protein [Planctomycetota bacterium]